MPSNPSLKNKSYGWGSKKQQNLKVKTNLRGEKIAQRVKVTATKSADPSLIWGVYMVEGRTVSSCKLSSDVRAHTTACAPTHQTHPKEKNMVGFFFFLNPQIDIFFS